MRFFSKSFTAALLLWISLPASAKDSAYVQFVFTAPLRAGNFYLAVHDGINEHKIDMGSGLNWKGELFAPFGHILVRYVNGDNTSLQKEVFFKKGKAKIVISPSKNDREYYLVDTSISENYASYEQVGGVVFESFMKEKNDEVNAFISKYGPRLNSDTVILRQAFALGDSLTAKTIEFVRRFPNLYISFWLFCTQTVNTSFIGPDSLMKIYKEAYLEKYKNYKAGKYLEARISNKIAVRSYQQFPAFSMTDIAKNKLESSKLRGKYVLIQFWASWCVPCVQEMPGIKELNEKYKSADFVLISISIDKDSVAFRKSLERYSMDWAQVYGDLELYNSLAYFPIPQIYLVDKTGRTIYNSTVTRDADLALLKKLLAEHLRR